MNKAVKKSLIIVGGILGGFVALFLLLYAVLAIIGCAMYVEYREIRKTECVIAGLSTGLAPQGITYSAERELFIQTGYDGDGYSVMYLVHGDEAREVELLNDKGERLKGHAGGVTVSHDCVYVANGSYLYKYSLAALENANGGVRFEHAYPVDNNAAYCYNDDNYMYVGEFYREQNYKTDASHHYTTPSGEENKAIVSVYALDADGLLVCEADGQPYPEYRISITGLVQGFAVSDGVIMLSRSYGLVNSAIEYHNAPKSAGKDVEVTFKKNENAEKRSVPLYYLDSTTLFKSLVAPSFTEDLTVKDGRLVVTNEASANKYFVGKLFGANKVYSLPIFKDEEWKTKYDHEE